MEQSFLCEGCFYSTNGGGAGGGGGLFPQTKIEEKTNIKEKGSALERNTKGLYPLPPPPPLPLVMCMPPNQSDHATPLSQVHVPLRGFFNARDQVRYVRHEGYVPLRGFVYVRAERIHEAAHVCVALLCYNCTHVRYILCVERKSRFSSFFSYIICSIYRK